MIYFRKNITLSPLRLIYMTLPTHNSIIVIFKYIFFLELIQAVIRSFLEYHSKGCLGIYSSFKSTRKY